MPVLIRVRWVIAVELSGGTILRKRSKPDDDRRSLVRSTVSSYNNEDGGKDINRVNRVSVVAESREKNIL